MVAGLVRSMGLEDWGQPWGDLYLSVRATGGGGGFHWSVVMSGVTAELLSFLLAGGYEPTLEAAGRAAVTYVESFRD